MKSKMIQILSAVTVAVLLLSFSVGTVHAKKVKVTTPPVSDYDFKSVKNIVVMPVASNGTDFGKVAKDRMPKIRAVLEKVKRTTRQQFIDSTRLINTTIPFVRRMPNRRPTTVLLELNIDKFDNGNQAARRLIPFAGKAKVSITGRLVSAKNKRVLTEFHALRKTKSGVTQMAGVGAFDSDVLMQAANDASGDIFRHLSKLTGFKYSKFSSLGERTKKGVKATGSGVKEEKSEIDNVRKKSKN